MTHATESTRLFRVHARHVDSHHARFVEETSFEAAVVAYFEDFDLSVPISDDHEMSVIVHDVGTGHEHCFKINLDSGEAAPCG
jgi:hypothetical protein